MEETKQSFGVAEIPKRPGFITLLAIVYVLGGILFGLISIGIMRTFTYHMGEQDFSTLKIVHVLIVSCAGYLVITVLSIPTAFGLIEGLRWGWCLGTALQMYIILTSIAGLTEQKFLISRPKDYSTVDPKDYILLESLFIIGYIGIYALYFRKDVLKFFNISDPKRLKLIVTEAFLWIIAMVVFHMLRVGLA